jgi:hypothetical protein
MLDWDGNRRGSGVVAVLVVAGLIYGRSPKVGASAGKLVSFYDGDRTRILVASVMFCIGFLTAADDGFAGVGFVPSSGMKRKSTEVVVPPSRAGGQARTRSPTAAFRTNYVWRREYAPADASAGRSATACAVTLFTSGAATAAQHDENRP